MPSAMQSLNAMRHAWPDRQHWPSTLVLATAALLYLFAGISLASVEEAGARASSNFVASGVTGAAMPREAPPVPEPLAFRDMTVEEAASYNASIPVASEPNPAARPFTFNPAGENDSARAADCLTAAVYYEAAIEPVEGQKAVAQVILNRVRHPAYPNSVCGVVFEGSTRATGCQFTFTCDGSLARTPSQAGWARARGVAEQALAGKVYKPVGYATHYHTNWVVPYWSSSLTKLANVGTHIFYRWEGGWGRPGAFGYRASGTEPEIPLMRHLSSVPMELVDGEAPVGPVASEPGTAGGAPSIEGRVVVRRYEPLREQAAATAKAELAKKDVPQSLRWALTGEGSGASAPSLGSKSSSLPAGTTPSATPAPAASAESGK